MTPEQTEQKLVDKLEGFYKNLLEYWKLGVTLYNAKLEMAKYPAKEWGKFQTLRKELLDLYGGLRGEIEKYGGPATVRFQSNAERNAFGLALGHMYPSKGTFTALDGCTSVVRLAIGKLKSLTPETVEAGSVDAKLGPKAFIAHGGQSACLKKLRDFLIALGLEAVVAEWKESEGRWTEEHVDKLMSDSDCYIILAEYGGIIDVKTGAKHPRLNVIDELARSREKRRSRTILLLEKDVDLPSNDEGIVYEHFTKQNMEKAFIKVAKELVAFGIIKAVKPSE
jgi:predicted nucleotide-binding protein